MTLAADVRLATVDALGPRAAAPRATGLLGPVALVVLTVWLIAPILPVVIAALGRGWFFPALLPRLDLSAWRYAASPVSGVVAAAAESLVIAVAVTLLAMAAAIPAGRVLALRRFRGRTAVELLMLAPALVPPLAVAMGLHALFLRLGLAGTRTGVVLVHLVPALPYAVLVVAGVFSRYDTAYEDQARSLGAGRLQVLRHVTLPMLAPGLAVAAAFVFLVSWSQYGPTLLIGGGRVTTLPLILTQFAGAGRLDVAGVAAILTILPGLVVLALASRLVAGARPGRVAAHR